MKHTMNYYLIWTQIWIVFREKTAKKIWNSIEIVLPMQSIIIINICSGRGEGFELYNTLCTVWAMISHLQVSNVIRFVFEHEQHKKY